MSLYEAQRPIAIEGIYLIGGEGHRVRDLREDRKEVYCPAWSPDGQWLAYSQSAITHSLGVASVEEGIGIVRPDGTGEVHVTSGADEAPSWSPDGKRIVFSRFTHHDRAKLCIADVATRHVVDITDDAALNRFPSWSPLGDAIAFTSNRSGTDKLWLQAPRRDHPRLIPHQPAGSCGFPAWSPTGKTILFTCATGDVYGFPAYLFMTAPDGSHRKRLAISRVVADHVAWSPDGGQIAFVCSIAPRKAAVFIASLHTLVVRQIYPRIGEYESVSWPAW